MALLLFGFLFFQACSSSSSSANVTAAVTTDSLTIHSDTSGLPDAVMAKFSSLFPTKKDVHWEVEEGNYEATFQDSTGEKSVTFAPDGHVLVSESTVQQNSLPEGVNQYIADHLQGKKIDHAQMVLTTSGVLTYEVEVEGQEYIFSGDGKFKEIEKAEADEKD